MVLKVSIKLKSDNCVREAGLEPARPKTQVPKTCVSAISPLPLKSAYLAVLVSFCLNAAR